MLKIAYKAVLIDKQKFKGVILAILSDVIYKVEEFRIHKDNDTSCTNRC